MNITIFVVTTFKVLKLNDNVSIFLLAGTNVEEAKKILAESNLPISSASDLDDAAKKAVASL